MDTGNKFFRAKSKGETSQIAATGINAHGINVPPPIQIVHICPIDAKAEIFIDIDWEKSIADEPTNERPEKPDPSRPVSRPTLETVAVAIALFNGTALESAIPRSLIIPLELAGYISPIIDSKPFPPR